MLSGFYFNRNNISFLLNDKINLRFSTFTCFHLLKYTSAHVVKLDQYGTHFTTENILDTLRNMNVMNMQDLFYAATYQGSQVCTALNGVYGLGLDKRYYLPKELNKKINKILKYAFHTTYLKMKKRRNRLFKRCSFSLLISKCLKLEYII